MHSDPERTDGTWYISGLSSQETDAWIALGQPSLTGFPTRPMAEARMEEISNKVAEMLRQKKTTK